MNPARPYGLRLAASRLMSQANAVTVLAICVVFAVVIVAGFYVVRDPTIMSRPSPVASLGGLAGGQTSSPESAAELQANDPVTRFSATGVGHLLFARADSDNCRRILFDNRRGMYFDAEEVFCGQRVVESRVEAPGMDRMIAIRKSFQR